MYVYMKGEIIEFELIEKGNDVVKDIKALSNIIIRVASLYSSQQPFNMKEIHEHITNSIE